MLLIQILAIIVLAALALYALLWVVTTVAALLIGFWMLRQGTSDEQKWRKGRGK